MTITRDANDTPLGALMTVAGTNHSGKIYSRAELATRLGGVLIGENSAVFKLSDPSQAQADDVVCVLRPEYLSQALASAAGLVVLSQDLYKTVMNSENDGVPEKAFLTVPDSELAWGELLKAFMPPQDFSPGIHDNAVIHPSALIGKNVHLAANVVVGSGANIGAGSSIMAGCFIGERVVLGENCQIYPNVSLLHDVQLGNRVLVQSGAVVGSDGFGFRRDQQHQHWRLPHIGTVILDDDVEIGANCVIDRATVGVTRIGERSKLGPACIVAHNGKIGSDVLLIGAVQLAGSTTIGDKAVLFGQVGAAGHISIGEGATVTAQSGISKDLEAGKTYRGSPAQPIQDQLRMEARVRDLEKLTKRLEKLEKKMGENS